MILFLQERANSGLGFESLASTIVYALLGISITVGAIAALNVIFKLDLHKELVEDQNIAFGVAIGGFAIAIAIILGSTILS